MKIVFATAAVLATLIGAASAQTATPTPKPAEESVFNNDSSMVNSDAALPGASESGSTSTASGVDNTTTSSTSGGTSSQIVVPNENGASTAGDSTPSSGLVPGQTPE